MINKYDITEFVKTTTIDSAKVGVVNRLRLRRKEKKLSQKDLAIMSSVSYASIRRFETTGEISFNSLLRIANVLGCLDDFNELFSHEIITNLKDY